MNVSNRLPDKFKNCLQMLLDRLSMFLLRCYSFQL